MKLYLFDTQSELLKKFPDYNPNISRKIYRVRDIEYFRAGTALQKQNCLWKVAQFFKALGLSLVGVAFCGRKYRDLVAHTWRQFKIGSEKVDLYVKGLLHLDVTVTEGAKEISTEKCEIFSVDNEDLIKRLQELLSLRDNKDGKKAIIEILSRLEFKRLDRLIDSEKFNWRDLLFLFATYGIAFSVASQENIRRRIEAGLEKIIFFDPPLSKEEIASLIHFKLAENPKIYYSIESSPDFFKITEEVFKCPLTDIPQGLLQHCLSDLTSRLEETEFNDINSFKETFQNSCEASDLNLMPLPSLYLLIKLSNKMEIPLSKLGVLSEDKTRALIKEWNDNEFKKNGLINAIGRIPDIRQRQEMLKRVFLNLEEEEFIDYLNAKNNQPETIYCNIIQGNQDLESGRCVNMLRALYDKLKNSSKEIWSKIAVLATIEQAFFILNLDRPKSDGWEFVLLEALKKDVRKVLGIIPEEHHTLALVTLFTHPEYKGVQKQFLRELAFQNKLEKILHKKNIKNFSKDNMGLNFADLYKRLTDEELKKCVHHYAQNEIRKFLVDDAWWHTFLMNFSYQAFSSFSDLALLGGKATRKFFLCYDELAEHYPNNIPQLFHGMILGLNSNIREHEVKQTVTKEQLDSAINFIDNIRAKHPNCKEFINNYFDDYFKGIFGEAWEERFGLLNVILAIREYSAQIDQESFLEWLTEMSAYHLQFLLPYISFYQKKAILEVFFDRFKKINDLESLKDYSILLKALEKILPAEEFKKLQSPHIK